MSGTNIEVTVVDTPPQAVEVTDKNFKEYVEALPQEKFDAYGPDEHDKIDPLKDWGAVKLGLARAATMAAHGAEMLGGKPSLDPRQVARRAKENARLGMNK